MEMEKREGMGNWWGKLKCGLMDGLERKLVYM